MKPTKQDDPKYRKPTMVGSTGPQGEQYPEYEAWCLKRDVYLAERTALAKLEEKQDDKVAA